MPRETAVIKLARALSCISETQALTSTAKLRPSKHMTPVHSHSTGLPTLGQGMRACRSRNRFHTHDGSSVQVPVKTHPFLLRRVNPGYGA